jgi:hypothetical protein
MTVYDVHFETNIITIAQFYYVYILCGCCVQIM